MDESPRQIEDHIRSTRGALESNLQELEHKVKDATNWRVQFARHPAVFLGAALAGGMLLAAALGSSHSSTDRALGRSPKFARPQSTARLAQLSIAAAQLGALIAKLIPVRQQLRRALHR